MDRMRTVVRTFENPWTVCIVVCVCGPAGVLQSTNDCKNNGIVSAWHDSGWPLFWKFNSYIRNSMDRMRTVARTLEILWTVWTVLYEFRIFEPI